jgi:hypothetical protein
LLGAVLALSSCARHHYVGGVRHLPATQGWLELPTGSWLLNDGLIPAGASFCPRDPCEGEGLVARFRLTGAEVRAARLLADDPARALLGAERATARRLAAKARRPAAPRGTTEVVAFSLDDWRGAAVTLHPSARGTRPAHVVALARLEADAADLLISVAANAEKAREQAEIALGRAASGLRPRRQSD